MIRLLLNIKNSVFFSFSPLFFALVIIGSIELGIKFKFNPPLIERSSWIINNPYRGEHFDRLILYEKIRNFETSNPDIITVGDSSGLFSIQPKIVMGYLGGLKMINFSTGANNGYLGYQSTAEYILQKNKSVKYVVLNVYPHLLPSKRLLEMSELGPIIKKNFASTKRFLQPPSAVWHADAVDLFFLYKRRSQDSYKSKHKVALEAKYTIKDTLGYIHEHDIRKARHQSDGGFYPVEKLSPEIGFKKETIQFEALKNFAEMCKKYQVQMILSFNPLGWQCFKGTLKPGETIFETEPNLEENLRELERFQRAYPKVWILDVLRLWEPIKVAGQPHVAREYSHLNSAWLGRTIKHLIETPESYRPFDFQLMYQRINNQFDLRNVSIIDVDGNPSKKQKQAALAYLMYTATGEEKYKKRFSKKTIRMLERDDAFMFMIWDTRTRLDALKWQGISFDYRFDDLKTTFINAENLQRCVRNDNGTIWIKLSGAVNYIINSGRDQLSEAVVKWPYENQIAVPIIYEDDMWKFDGYCPEDTGDKSIEFNITHEMLGIEMVRINPSTIGSDLATPPFYISTHDVNQFQWLRVMGDNPSKIKHKDHPVGNVSLKDIHAFIHRLNLITGIKFRLPNEKERELVNDIIKQNCNTYPAIYGENFSSYLGFRLVFNSNSIDAHRKKITITELLALSTRQNHLRSKLVESLEVDPRNHLRSKLVESLEVDPRNQSVVNTPISFKANTNVNDHGLLWSFFAKPPGKKWIRLRDYDQSNVLSWIPKEPGEWKFNVWVKTKESNNKFDDFKEISYYIVSMNK